MNRKPEIVTDHAVVRYLENVYGVDISHIRRRIEKATTAGRDLGATAVIKECVRYRLDKEGRVLTVEGTRGIVSARGRRWKDRRK